MSLATVSLATSSLRTMSLATMSLTTIVPSDNCSSRQLCLATIIPPLLYKWSFTKRTVLRMNKIKGTDGGARIAANDHPDDPVSSVLLRSFANGHLQRGRFSR